MDTQWTEFVYVEAYYFGAGQQPWTEQDWYLNAQRDPEKQLMDPRGPFETDHPLEPPQDPTWWQDGYLWWTPDDYVGEENRRIHTPIYECYDYEASVLTQGVVRFSIQPLDTGAWPEPAYNSPGQSLLTWQVKSYSLSETFQREQLDELEILVNSLRQPKNGQIPSHIAVLTVWQCEVQRDYWSADEDYAWWPIGHIAPGATSVTYVSLKEVARKAEP